MRRERRGGSARAAALEEEIRLHMELRTAQLIEEGWEAGAARAEAERRFGGEARARRSLYRAAQRRDLRVRVRGWVDAARQDGRSAVRTLVREPGFAGMVILTMALAIGANAAMFGAVDRLLLRGPDHVRDPDSLMNVYAVAVHPEFGERRASRFGHVTYATLGDIGPAVFAGVAAYRIQEGILGRGEEAEPIRLGVATHDYFPLLGVRPALGRFYTAEEDGVSGGRDVIVLSHETWRRRFSADPDVAGRTVDLRGAAHTVIGVAPPGFTGTDLERVDAWVPMSTVSRGLHREWPTTWQAQWLRVVVRLAPGVSAEAAAEAGTRTWRAVRQQGGASVDPRLALAPLRAGEAGVEPLESAVARWLVGVAAVVLLIACANVMNLLLARGARRGRETAVRVALGIGRGRLAWLLFMETLLLIALGAAAGLVLAAWGGALIRSFLLPEVAWTTSPVDGRVIVFTIGVTLTAGLFTALVPVLRFAGRTDPARALYTGGRDGGGRRSRLRTTLTVAQAALSVVLLVAAGLFVRSLDRALNADLGIDADAVLTVEMRWPRQAPVMDSAGRAARQAVNRSRNAFYDRALAQVRGMAGVEHAALSVGTPFHTTFGGTLRVPGHDSIPAMPGDGPFIAAVSPDFFATVGIRLVRGRVFDAGEGAGSEPVTVINETMARVLWPDADALGRCLLIGDGDAPPCARIVGVVAESRRFLLREEPAMQYYIPLGQEQGFSGPVLLVRPRGDREAFVARLRAELRKLDGEGAYPDIESLRQTIDPQVRPWRLGTLLFGVFGVLALFIAAVGMYAVVAYDVTRRTREMGVRMVLGARRTDVRALVLRQGAGVAIAGVGLGLLAALAAGPLVQGLLFDVSPRDPWVLGGVAALLVGVALLASWLPARRATRVDPVVALSAE